MNLPHQRFLIIDALRGYAILAIILLHSLEQYNIYFLTQRHIRGWWSSLDQSIQDIVQFLFLGKVYPLFALLFGVTFFLIWNKMKSDPSLFRIYFFKRIFWLFLLGCINSLFNHTDILINYSILALGLLPVVHLKDKYIWGLFVCCALQPFLLFQWIEGTIHPVFDLNEPFSWAFYSKMKNYVFSESFIELISGNITNGKIGSFINFWEQGKLIQIYAMFLLGFLVAKNEWFIKKELFLTLWKKILFMGVIVFIVTYSVRLWILKNIITESIHRPAIACLDNWSSLAFLSVIVMLFVRLYYLNPSASFFKFLSYPGRMSLTNYILQSVLGGFIFYGYGLALYPLNFTFNFLIGVSMAILLALFSRWWIIRYHKGILESVWR